MISSTHRIKLRFLRDHHLTRDDLHVTSHLREKASPSGSDKLLRQRVAANYRLASSHHLDTVSWIPRVEYRRNFEDPKHPHIM
jgi:hypothetical protein